MGRPSDKARSARRLGKRERARVKRERKSEWTTYVSGGETLTSRFGRKKARRVLSYHNRWSGRIFSGNL